MNICQGNVVYPPVEVVLNTTTVDELVDDVLNQMVNGVDIV